MEPTVGRPPLPGEPVRTRATRISRSGRRRRPSGEAPPLPRPLTTGTYWLAATGVVLLLWLVALANSATNNYILAFDLTLLDWVSQLRTVVLTNVMRGVHALGSLWTVRVLFWATVAVLVVTRRFRHLFVFVGAVVGVIALSSLLAYLFMRPRPLEVEILGDWTGAAHPARPVAVFAATVVGMLYSLVPQGRLRQLGKPVIAVLVTALSISLVYLGVNSPTDVLIGAIIGVTIPLVASGCSLPTRSSRSPTGAAARPTWTWAAAAARPSTGPWRTGWASRCWRSSFGLSGSAGSTPLRVCAKG